jgi:lipoprotein-anchoring transpeptidase ErfK/SrfK
MNCIRPLYTSLALAALSSCALQHPTGPETIAKAEPVAPKLFSWDGPSIQGKAKVNIDLGEQKARIYDNGQEVAWTYVATGVEEHPTPRGTFRITEKKADKHSNIWGIVEDANGDTINWNAHSQRSSIPSGGRFVGAPMPHWMRLTDTGIGMHAGPIPDPGSPASHGCIRLPSEMASRMFEELPAGTPVTIME